MMTKYVYLSTFCMYNGEKSVAFVTIYEKLFYIFNGHMANVSATIGVNSSGHVAGGYNSQSVNYQLRNHTKAQRARESDISDAMENTIPIPRPMDSEYMKELEKVRSRFRLAREVSRHFRDVNKYIPNDHRNRPSPLTQIHNAYSIKIDTTEYMNNRNYFSKLYRSMRRSGIDHSNLVILLNNPYVNAIRCWNKISNVRQQIIGREYPEIPEVAKEYNKWTTSEGIDDCTIDFALFASGIKGIANTATTAWKLFFSRKVTQTAVDSVAYIRPSWRQTEQYLCKLYGKKSKSQISYLNGKEVPYGTAGSVRPDFIHKGKAVEAKNYDIAKNSSGLISKIAEQVNKRAIHLPKGTPQGVYIDIRGQKVTKATMKKIEQKIVEKCNGILTKRDIEFIEK